ATGLDEADIVEPRSPHGVAKLAGEMYLRAYAEEFGMSPICLALSNVYGPRQGRRGEAGLVAVLGTALITGSPFMINRGAADAHDFVYVDDVVEAFLRAADAPHELTGTYNIGTGRRTTASEVYRLISAVLDGTPVGACADIGVDESPALTLNSEKANRAFDWKPRIDLAEGVRRTIDWLCDVLESEGSAIAACDPGAA
ncbi:MAG TPA: NAD-dependent epimerase/dehydratase family protein, partial [Mycobacterium sp.]|nr:NAD-dependent epimerase/dehydratase family protein [Mycobacterium sp.]